MNYCTIYIVRHGETDWNVARLIQGHTDTPLNKTGELQAQELGKSLENIEFHKVISSDLLRARRTAELVALEKQIAVETTHILRERRFGSLEGQPGKRLGELDALLSKLDTKARQAYKENPDMESDEEVINRIMPYLRELAVAYPGKTILIVTHGGIMRLLIQHFGLTEFIPPKINNAAYLKLESDGVDFFVKETKGIEKHA